MSKLTFIPSFSVKCLFQLMYTDFANEAYFDQISHLNHLLLNHRTKLNETLQG